jgi:hypothetical protein
MGLDTSAKYQTPNRLANLDANSATGMGKMRSKSAWRRLPTYTLNPPWPDPECFDRRESDQVANPPKIHETHATWSKSADLVFADPAINDTPGIESHLDKNGSSAVSIRVASRFFCLYNPLHASGGEENC